MRDPKRFDSILAAVKKVWQLQPDTRLGQLIINLSHPIPSFYIEDDILLERLEGEYWRLKDGPVEEDSGC